MRLERKAKNTSKNTIGLGAKNEEQESKTARKMVSIR